MKRILIFSFSNLRKDPRVRRQIELLKPHYHVISAGFEDPEIDGVQFLLTPNIYHAYSLWQKFKQVITLVGLRAYEKYYWRQETQQRAYENLKNLEIDLILANDLDTLPIAIRLAQEKNIPIHFDAHEYAPKEFEDRMLWKIVYQPYRMFLCQKYLPQIQSMSTVCQGIANAYQSNFGIKSEILPNAAFYHKLSIRPPQSDKIRMIHHGGAMVSRKLETMIEMMSFLDERFLLDFMLLPVHQTYYESLQKLAAPNPRIRFIPPVETTAIIPFSNQYDIGLFLLPPTNFNYQHALPNKLFEFIQSRLAVGIGPSPEMAQIVHQYDCGIIAKDFQPKTLANELLKLTPERLSQMKKNTEKAAHELAFENFSSPFLKRIENLMNPIKQG